MEKYYKEYDSNRHCQCRQNLRKNAHRRIPFSATFHGHTVRNLDFVKPFHKFLRTVDHVHVSFDLGYKRNFRYTVAMLQHAGMPFGTQSGDLAQRHACNARQSDRFFFKPGYRSSVSRSSLQYHRKGIVALPESSQRQPGRISQGKFRFKYQTVQAKTRCRRTFRSHNHRCQRIVERRTHRPQSRHPAHHAEKRIRHSLNLSHIPACQSYLYRISRI